MSLAPLTLPDHPATYLPFDTHNARDHRDPMIRMTQPRHALTDEVVIRLLIQRHTIGRRAPPNRLPPTGQARIHDRARIQPIRSSGPTLRPRRILQVRHCSVSSWYWMLGPVIPHRIYWH